MPSGTYQSERSDVRAWIERETKKVKEQQRRLDELLADEKKLREAVEKK
jgi:hypothetical protein